jgi:hypothetical protein
LNDIDPVIFLRGDGMKKTIFLKIVKDNNPECGKCYFTFTQNGCNNHPCTVNIDDRVIHYHYEQINIDDRMFGVRSISRRNRDRQREQDRQEKREQFTKLYDIQQRLLNLLQSSNEIQRMNEQKELNKKDLNN